MPEPDLTPEEEQVRRLLADARHDEPLPADVADRLDRVLTDLRSSSEPETAPATDPVPDLAAARRRRMLRNLVLAAAAVVVVGVGISRVDLSGTTDADSSSGSADSSVQSDAGDDAGGSNEAPSAGAAEAAPITLSLRSDAFDAQVERYAATGRLATLSELRSTQADTEEKATGGGAYAAECVGGGLGRGRPVAATYDGEPALLVVRPAADGTRQVDLYLCGSTEPVRSTSVPAP
ncbi:MULTISPECIES: hypothetical protein [unclassified Nocardioides]|uniref:hypothetical protein n=1 Tax=unclassified Nocardioides TaxID=2615069 RepID=UPI003613BBCC